MIKIHNRRYIGSKSSLVEHIYNAVEKNIKKKDYTIADLFGGTGIVSTYFLNHNKKTIINDILYSNFVAYKAFLDSGEYNLKKIKKIINTFNKIKSDDLKENYFSKIYGGKYFSIKQAKKIGYIREEISNIRLKERERFILLTSLMYATDKVANTVGHFEHFLSKTPKDKDIHLDLLDINDKLKAEIYMEDANELVKKITSDVVYIDPPYNARQYINFYHVLENLVTWNKPMEFEGTSMKFKRDHLKSDYSKSKAPMVMKDLIDNLNTDLIIVSYNNTYSAKSISSNNKITEEELESILKNKGKIIEKKVINHKFFNSGKTNFKEHKEFLYVYKTS